jgi:ATP-dependent helicase/nuclease subunit B
LSIAAGLNEGIWPEAPKPDPWLNRRMRLHDAGLLLPERRIGLSAHDFQQAITAPEVILSRAIRDAETVTVPSRWLNRLTNLLEGISTTARPRWTTCARAARSGCPAHGGMLDRPKAAQPPAPRPAPRPPRAARPKRLSITRVQTLIRDPYAIYADSVLSLRPLDPLRQGPDAPLRGTVLHKVFERFVGEVTLTDRDADRARLMAIADEVLEADAPWPAARRIWRAKLARVADWFLDGEEIRRATDSPLALERKGEMHFDTLDLTLTGKLDRVDLRPDGTLAIYDYKTGQVPTDKQIRHFDKQLYLAAMMAEAGMLKDVCPPRRCPASRISGSARRRSCGRKS